MKLSRYVKDRLLLVAANAFAMLLVGLFLLAVGLQPGEVALVLGFWAIFLLAGLGAACFFANRRMRQRLALLNGLDKKYLIQELLGEPQTAEEEVWFEMLAQAGRSMLEHVSAVSREGSEYKQYIEQWVHEVKTPITGIRLMCENDDSELAGKVQNELWRIDGYVEQALFYARMETAEKDYLIKEVLLTDIVHSAIAQNKQLLVSSGASLRCDDSPLTAYTDGKWLEFILNQLIRNAVQYKKSEPLVLQFSVQQAQNGVALLMSDNGMGIAESELPRIFDKGFTGQKGRQIKSATGLGLYLCKRLCEKLGIRITARSQENVGTQFTLLFPKGSFVKM